MPSSRLGCPLSLKTPNMGNPGLVLWFVVGSILIIGCTASLPEAEDRPETAAPSATAMEPDGVAVETATPSATAMEPDGVAVINELIACEPGTWDRSRLLENLEREGDKYIETVKMYLELCELAKNATPIPTSTPRNMFSPEALELLAAFHELVKFKDETWFHIFCYAEASPAHDWAEYMSSAESQTFSETGIGPIHLWLMGTDYCGSEGKETTYTTQVLQDSMKPDWLNYRPIPAPKQEFRVMPNRPYEFMSEKLADCVWHNKAVHHLFQEGIDVSSDASGLAAVIEAALEEATDTKTWDGAILALTLCQSTQP